MMFNSVNDKVMKEVKNIRSKWLTVRVDQTEHELVLKQFKKTTETHLSKYIRKIILGQPMIGRVRNDSLQEVVIVLNRMQKDLNGIANNYNQMIHRLHISDTRSELLLWIKLYESQRELLFENIRVIKECIEKTSEKWLQ